MGVHKTGAKAGQQATLGADWKDKISSFKVMGHSTCKVKLFKGENYGAASIVKGKATYNAMPTGWNDVVESIKLGCNL